MCRYYWRFEGPRVFDVDSLGGGGFATPKEEKIHPLDNGGKVNDDDDARRGWA